MTNFFLLENKNRSGRIIAKAARDNILGNNDTPGVGAYDVDGTYNKLNGKYRGGGKDFSIIEEIFFLTLQANLESSQEEETMKGMRQVLAPMIPPHVE